jgi:hypothetical protein
MFVEGLKTAGWRSPGLRQLSGWNDAAVYLDLMSIALAVGSDHLQPDPGGEIEIGKYYFDTSIRPMLKLQCISQGAIVGNHLAGVAAIAKTLAVQRHPATPVPQVFNDWGSKTDARAKVK